MNAVIMVLQNLKLVEELSFFYTVHNLNYSSSADKKKVAYIPMLCFLCSISHSIYLSRLLCCLSENWNQLS